MKRITIYVVLVLVTLLSWTILQLNKPEQIIENKKPAHNPDFFSTGYSKLELDENGERKSEILASKLIHYHDDETIELDDPILRTFDVNKLSWEIEADNGWLSGHDDQLLLKGNVIISRGELTGHRVIRVKTNNLRVKTKQNYAETDDEVEIFMPPDKTTGVGMQIYFDEPIHLKLLNKVKGRYVRH
jgi:lipopolysaccharide export system protein LptC